ncbi:MAG: peptide chain release factor N(5)-glutamine methyltransferase [Anaerolineae bacterium]|nr:peptide chain release factor N(5)-glutamine methyltransferase [Anaerolineae bacterium]
MGQTVGGAVRAAQQRFQTAGVETAGLDAQVLLGYVLGVGRAWLIAHPEAPLTPDQAQAFERLVQRREARQPVAYLTGQREFYGLVFQVDERVLVPRPETELLVERAIGLVHEWLARYGQWPRVVDVGTGSGAIGVSLAVTVPELPTVNLVDVSPAALDVARANAERHGVAGRLRFWIGDLLAPLPAPVNLVLANLPYIEADVIPTLAPEVQQEPRLALDGGPDGLDPFRRLFTQVPTHVSPAGVLLLEIGAGQGRAVAELAQVLRPQAVSVHPDLAGLDRLVEVYLRE